IELAGGAGFLLESPDTAGIAGERTGDEFQRDVPIETMIACAIDLAHAAGAEPANDLVRPDPRTGHVPRRHPVGSTFVSVVPEALRWNVISCDPMRMWSPSTSAMGAPTRSAPRNVPFLLPKSSSTTRSALTTIRACRRETVDASIRIDASRSRPITCS